MSNIRRKMKNIAIIRTSGSIIDLDKYNCQELGLAKALVKKGFKVSLILAGNKNISCKIFVNDNNYVQIYYVKCYEIDQALAWFINWKNIVDKIKPDIIQIHDFGLFMSYMILNWAKKNKIKTVLIQGNYQTTHKPILKLLERVYNKTFGVYILKYVDGIGCKTIYANKYIQSYFQRETYLTPVGLDTEKFQFHEKINWRHILHIEDKKVLLYIGVLEKRRNPLFLIDVLATLSSDYVLIIVGKGSMRQKVQEYAKHLEIGSRCILFNGFVQEDLPSLYQTADVFLLASNYEIYGMTIIEAMYFSLPVIASLTAGAQTLIINDVNGIIINKFDIYEWSNAIKRIVEDKEILNSIGKNSKELVENHLLWEQTVNSYIELYDKILSNQN